MSRWRIVKLFYVRYWTTKKKERKAWTSHTVKQYYSSFYDRFLLQPYFPSTIDFSSTPPLRSLLLSSQQFSAENDECVIRTCETTDAQLSQFITLNDANASSIIELWSFSDILLHAEQLRFRQRDMCASVWRLWWQQIATMFSLFCIISFSSFLYVSWQRQQWCQPDGSSSVMWCNIAMGMFSERKKLFQSFKSSSVRVYVLYCRIVDLSSGCHLFHFSRFRRVERSETLRNCVTFVKLRREVCSTKCAVMLACNLQELLLSSFVMSSSVVGVIAAKKSVKNEANQNYFFPSVFCVLCSSTSNSSMSPNSPGISLRMNFHL